MNVIGIDPGIGGAIAALNAGGLLGLWDMPVMAAGKGGATSKQKVNGAALAEILCQLKPAHVLLEEVSAMPRSGKPLLCPLCKRDKHAIGAATGFAFGRTLGCIEGVVLASGCSLELVSAQAWKRRMGLNSDKEVSRAKAIELYPGAPLHLKKHHNRAEALLLARYGWGGRLPATGAPF